MSPTCLAPLGDVGGKSAIVPNFRTHVNLLQHSGSLHLSMITIKGSFQSQRNSAESPPVTSTVLKPVGALLNNIQSFRQIGKCMKCLTVIHNSTRCLQHKLCFTIPIVVIVLVYTYCSYPYSLALWYLTQISESAQTN